MTELPGFYRGDDHCFEVLVKVKDTDQPVDITGWLFTSTMKLSSELPDQPELDDQGNRQVLQVSTLASDGPDSKEGRVFIIYPHVKTAELLATNYQMDIQSNRAGVVQTLIKGVIPVMADVTHEVQP